MPLAKRVDQFVGRDREMNQLATALDGALEGRGRVVMLAGEPGIGKTRAAQELAAYASERGAQVLWGRCYEGEGAPPYWPWVQAIREYVAGTDEETVRSTMSSAAAVIAQIVPEVKEKLSDLEDPSQIDDLESARFRLFDSITKFLKSAGNPKPIVVILEDLHLADKPSLLLLEFVVREMSNSRLMIVGNYRDMDLNRRHPLAATLGELTREHLFDRLLLRGLEKSDVRRFIEVVAGFNPPDSLVEVVHTQTEGNPLFVSETVRLLIQEGDITFGEEPKAGIASWDIRIPEGVREVIGRRLDRLSAQCNEILIIAGVMGRQFRFGVLLNLLEDVTENSLLDLLDEALDANIVEEEPSEVGLYQFTHALMRETLASELSANRTVRLHARIAEALEDFWGDGADEHADELVEHFAEAETVLGSSKAAHYSVIAGERALENAAPEAALEHFERAEAARGEQEVDAEGARIFWGLGRARTATATTGQTQDALDTLIQAFDYYARMGDTASAVKIAVEPVLISDVVGIADLLDRALDLVSADSFEAGEIMCRLGSAVWFEYGDEERFTEIMARSLELAREFDRPVLEMRTLSIQANIAGLLNQYSECIELAQQVAQLAATVSDPGAEANAHWQHGVSYMHLGEPNDAATQLELGTRAAERPRHMGRMGSYSQLGQTLALFLGDWDRVREISDTEMARGRRRMFGILANAQTGSRTGQKNVDEYLALERVPGHEGLHKMFIAAMLATIDPDDTRWAEAPNLVRTWNGLVEHSETPHSVRERGRPFVAAAIGLLAEGYGHDEMVELAYSELNHLQHTALDIVSVDRMLGRLAGVLGQPDNAVVHFEDALEFCRNAGYKPELAWTCHDYVEVLLDRPEDTDRVALHALLDEGMAITEELKMTPLGEQLAALREAIGEASVMHPAGLTNREVEVLRELASGKSNREIADVLFITQNTVIRHVANIFGKTGSANRVEAAAYAMRNALVESVNE